MVRWFIPFVRWFIPFQTSFWWHEVSAATSTTREALELCSLSSMKCCSCRGSLLYSWGGMMWDVPRPLLHVHNMVHHINIWWERGLEDPPNLHVPVLVLGVHIDLNPNVSHLNVGITQFHGKDHLPEKPNVLSLSCIKKRLLFPLSMSYSPTWAQGSHRTSGIQSKLPQRTPVLQGLFMSHRSNDILIGRRSLLCASQSFHIHPSLCPNPT